MSEKNKELKIGDRKILKKPTFLYKGIFVLTGSTVEVKSISPTLVVEWHDREGNPHLLESIIKMEELE